MTTTPISQTPLPPQLQQYFRARSQDLLTLQNALQSGDLTAAQQAYSAIVKLGQSGPFRNGEPFVRADREKDFEAIGQALQSGDLAAAQQALATLKSTFNGQPSPAMGSSTTSPSVGPDAIVNLSSSAGV